MDISSFWDGMLAGYGIAVPVGAIAVLIIDVSIRRGLASGLQAGAGAASADILYAVVAAVSGTLLGSWLLPFADTFRVLGGVALTAMGVWGFRQAWRDTKQEVQPHPKSDDGGRTYLTFLGLTLLNPLTIVYFSALILGDLQSDRTVMNRLAFVVGAGIASLSWQWLLALFGTFAGRRLPEKVGAFISVAGNLVVIYLGLRLFF